VGRQQIWIGGDHVGRTIGIWVDTTTIHLAYDRVGGPDLKTVPSRLTTAHLTRLRAAGAVPAGPPPVPRIAARGAPQAPSSKSSPSSTPAADHARQPPRLSRATAAPPKSPDRNS
jgi:hypothetical protein